MSKEKQNKTKDEERKVNAFLENLNLANQPKNVEQDEVKEDTLALKENADQSNPLDMDLTDEEFFKLMEANIEDYGAEDMLAIKNQNSEHHYRWTSRHRVRMLEGYGYRKVKKSSNRKDVYAPFADPDDPDIRYADYILMYTTKKIYQERQDMYSRRSQIHRKSAPKEFEELAKRLKPGETLVPTSGLVSQGKAYQ